jgi:lipoate synthase
MRDLRDANVDITNYQYNLALCPWRNLLPEQFAKYETIWFKLGFRHVESLVRSSYKAQKHIL